MGKLEPIENKRTAWQGLWFDHSTNRYSSAAFNLSDLKKFKGSVRLIIRKNKFYENGKNGRPNYVFMLIDSKAEDAKVLEFEDIQKEEQPTPWHDVWDESKTYKTGFICGNCGAQSISKTSFCPNCLKAMC